MAAVAEGAGRPAWAHALDAKVDTIASFLGGLVVLGLAFELMGGAGAVIGAVAYVTSAYLLGMGVVDFLRYRRLRRTLTGP